ncbi:serine-threonine/tyrosine-protein kinase catalytic domain-containing protein [Tanacetum coccineum]|uniref:Serine-threonine/tyrosine-protein kinase catalytic domain-containing protein n=1 Tax=Tanacetum coccineum TaxID=301880 RepID=A0ABQ5HBQ8_9ASTR
MSQLKDSRHLKIPFTVIQKATKNFETCIGKGGYGPVYKGELLYSGKPTKVANVKFDTISEKEHQLHYDVVGETQDQNWIAKIADFGLSKLSLAARGAVITLPCGTLGYCDPKYISTGNRRKKDLTYEEDGVGESPKVKDYYKKKKLDDIVDPNLSEQMNSVSMKKFTAIAYRLLEDARVQCPPMIHIVKELEESLEIQDKTGPPHFPSITSSNISPQFPSLIFGEKNGKWKEN